MAISPTFIREQFDKYVRMHYVHPLLRLMTFKGVDSNGGYARYRERLLRLGRTGEVVPAYIVQANNKIWHAGQGPAYPCLVLMTFDKSKMHDRKYMTAIVRKLQSLKGTTQYDQDLAAAARMVTDERAQRDRRQLLPMSLTEGVAVLAVDLTLHRARLEGGYLHTNEVTCIADPAPMGATELVPWWIEEGDPADAYRIGLSPLLSRSTAVTAGIVASTIAAAMFTAKFLPAAPTPTAETAQPAYMPVPTASAYRNYAPPPRPSTGEPSGNNRNGAPNAPMNGTVNGYPAEVSAPSGGDRPGSPWPTQPRTAHRFGAYQFGDPNPFTSRNNQPGFGPHPSVPAMPDPYGRRDMQPNVPGPGQPETAAQPMPQPVPSQGMQTPSTTDQAGDSGYNGSPANNNQQPMNNGYPDGSSAPSTNGSNAGNPPPNGVSSYGGPPPPPDNSGGGGYPSQ